MNYISIKNWEKFQHYKDRNPPWIKLQRDLLRDYDFCRLQDASKLHLMLLWLLASQLNNKIPNDPEWIKNQIGIGCVPNLKDLLDHGFIFIASGVLADCNQVDIVETEAEAYKEETEAESKDDDSLFYKMKELSALATKYLGWNGNLTQGKAESLRPLTNIFKIDVVRGFKAACDAGATSIKYVEKVASDNKQAEDDKPNAFLIAMEAKRK